MSTYFQSYLYINAKLQQCVMFITTLSNSSKAVFTAIKSKKIQIKMLFESGFLNGDRVCVEPEQVWLYLRHIFILFFTMLSCVSQAIDCKLNNKKSLVPIDFLPTQHRATTPSTYASPGGRGLNNGINRSQCVLPQMEGQRAGFMNSSASRLVHWLFVQGLISWTLISGSMVSLTEWQIVKWRKHRENDIYITSVCLQGWQVSSVLFFS